VTIIADDNVKAVLYIPENLVAAAWWSHRIKLAG
jgi:hypothetical protein